MATPTEAHCFSRWYYPWKQHCSPYVPTKYQEYNGGYVNAPLPPEKTSLFPERIRITLPSLDFTPCQEISDERLIGVAKMRGLNDSR